MDIFKYTYGYCIYFKHLIYCADSLIFAIYDSKTQVLNKIKKFQLSSNTKI